MSIVPLILPIDLTIINCTIDLSNSQHPLGPCHTGESAGAPDTPSPRELQSVGAAPGAKRWSPAEGWWLAPGDGQYRNS